MKPFAESSRLKEFRRCLKTMPKGPPTDKQNMGRKTNLKESIESSKFESSLKSSKESRWGGSTFDGCKASNALIVFKDAKTRVAQEP
jgi:hypothetical protein